MSSGLALRPSISTLRKAAGGCDTLHLSLQVYFPEFRTLSRLLDACKAAALRGESENSFLMLPDAICPKVRKHGLATVDRNMYFSWVLDCEGLLVALVNNGDLGIDSDGCNVVVRIGSLPLMMRGLDWCVEKYVKIIHALGGEIRITLINRLDMALDLPEVNVGYFCETYRLGRVRKRSRYVCFHGFERSWQIGCKDTGLQFGKSNLIRFYDKLEEIRTQHPERRPVLQAMRWGGVVPSCATRIEIQARRKPVLKELGINTMEDFKHKSAGFINYFLHDWFRILTKNYRGRNKEFQKIDPVWIAVVQEFLKINDSPQRSISREKVVSQASQDQLAAIVGGIVSKMYAAKHDEKPVDMVAVFQAVAPDLWKYIEPRNDKMLGRVLAHQAANQVLMPLDSDLLDDGDVLR